MVSQKLYDSSFFEQSQTTNKLHSLPLGNIVNTSSPVVKQEVLNSSPFVPLGVLDLLDAM